MRDSRDDRIERTRDDRGRDDRSLRDDRRDDRGPREDRRDDGGSGAWRSSNREPEKDRIIERDRERSVLLKIIFTMKIVS